MGRSRLPRRPASEIGLRPALKSMGTLARAALMTPPTALPAPTITWTMTAWARPVTMAKPWAMATAGTSCGTVRGRGAACPWAPRFAYASMSGALAHVNSPWRAGGERKSVPSLAPGTGRVKEEGEKARDGNDELPGRRALAGRLDLLLVQGRHPGLESLDEFRVAAGADHAIELRAVIGDEAQVFDEDV